MSVLVDFGCGIGLNNSSRECDDALLPALNKQSNKLDRMPAPINNENHPQIQQYVGKKFGKLTAVKFIEMRRTENSRGQVWEFECECGKRVINRISMVKRGHP